MKSLDFETPCKLNTPPNMFFFVVSFFFFQLYNVHLMTDITTKTNSHKKFSRKTKGRKKVY